MSNIEVLLSKANMPVVELGGTKRPPLPYIVYTVDCEFSGGDNLVGIVKSDVTAEVYTTQKTDTALMKVLIENNIPFSCSPSYIDSDRIYATTYDFSFYEKTGGL